MAHSLSAKKRVRQNAKRRAINRARKSAIKTQTKKFLAALTAGNVETAQQEFKTLVRKLDKVASTSTMHKNTAARIKSRMARRLNQMQVKAG
ncbi:MAG TPA: 30S ribosomal protein S20 [Anaerohalosphaeraceae bacterium]|nr:30S ribosomal protein S20 [Anaerohalosphaeraceae bacterium]HOL88555.1 30S ribosomal protein S20 [Anaerohalosphaeraceae bacterium]HPP56391.1 30S ribosomal protein S20 [Anaerohalosphaeraceae bacterium]